MTDKKPPPDLPGDLYALMVHLNVNSTQDLLEGFTREQLSVTELLLLERLRAGKLRPRMGQAATLMHVTPAGGSRIIDRLERRGMIERQPDEGNYRAKRIVITEHGEQAIARVHRARLEQIASFTERLEPDEREQLQATLDQLLKRENIRAYRPAPLPA